MKEIIVNEWVLKEIEDALRLAANALNSRERETAMDRSIDHSERLIKWLLNGSIGNPPKH